MPDQKQILNSIATIAKGLGRAPTHSEFFSRTGMSRYSVSQCFPKWNDAVRAAGLEPRRLRVRPEDSELLKDWALTVRAMRAVPTRYAYRRHGKFDPRTLEERFGGWPSIPQAFRKFARAKREWKDVLALLAAAVPCGPVPNDPRRRRNHNSASPTMPSASSFFRSPLATRHSPLKDRATYGNPTNFPEFRHEPVNEQGVVLLFGMLANDLGFLIEAVQKGFPDCEAKRQIAPGRWQRVQIEFEFESKNFRDHGHSVNGCDIIVCWRHNWPDCPKHIEVVELSRVLQSLAAADD